MFYATRIQPIAENVSEYQLMKFSRKSERDSYCDFIGGTAVSAKDAKKLCIADVWRTCRSVEADCVFHVARYIP